jgi:adenylate cyclase
MMPVRKEYTAEESSGVRLELDRIAESVQFSKSDRLVKFLRFVCEQAIEGRSAELKEILIGASVFDRAPDYDPKIDSIVRKEANRLRSRLEQYYASIGVGDPVRIELPKGAYVPVFHFSSTESPLPAKPRRAFAVAGTTAGALVAITLAVIIFWRLRPSEISIVVLPFENQSGDAAQDYFVDGLTTEIHHTLTMVERMRVIGRASSFTFRTRTARISEIAKSLHADYVLTGAVRRFGSRVSVRAELTRLDDVQIWSFGNVESDAGDILSLQDNIARSVVNALRRKFGNLRRRWDADPGTYELYWKARFLADEFRAPHADQAVRLLEDILKKDPSFAPAYASLNQAYMSISYNRKAPIRETEQMMYTAARKALELDPLLPEAHSAMGFALQRDYRWKDAELSFRRALELDPSSSEAFYGLGFAVLTKTGRLAEGELVLRSGLRIDPLSLRLKQALMNNLHEAGRCAAAVEFARAIPPDTGIYYEGAQAIIARCLCESGQVEQALSIMAGPDWGPWRCYCLASHGRKDQVQAEFESHRDDIFYRLEYYAAIHDADGVVRALEHEYETKDAGLPFHLNWREFAFLHHDLRYIDLRRRTGLRDLR